MRISTLLSALAIAITSAVFAPCNFFAADEEAAAKFTPPTEAGTFRGNAARTGYYPGALGTRTNGAKNLRIVYALLHDIGEKPDKSTYICRALNADTGEAVWDFEVGSPLAGSSVVADGIVYVVTATDSFYALHAATGQELWKAPIKTSGPADGLLCSGPPDRAPAVSNGVVFVFGENKVHAMNAKTGKELWAFGPACCKTITATERIVLIDSDSLYALSAKTGEFLWKAANVYTSPVEANDVVYTTDAEHFCAINAKTGADLWRMTKREMSPNTAVTLSDELAYFGSDDEHLYAFDAQTGHERWKFKTGDDSCRAPVVANGIVYFESGDGNFHALNAMTGETLWKINIGGGDYNSLPSIAFDRVYIVLRHDDDQPDCLSVFDAKTGKELWSLATIGSTLFSPAVADFAE